MRAKNIKRPISTKRTLITSFIVDASDVALNLTIAVITGSVVMLAETFQGMADLSAVFFLMIGHKQASRASTKKYPFGYGKELYFWSLLSGFIVCIITAGLSIYFGFEQLRSPQPVEHVQLAYGVLLFGVLSNGYAFSLSARKLLGNRPFRKVWRSFFDSYYVAPKTTFILDLMGTTAAIIGFIALVVYQLTGNQRLDGIGAMTIGITLAVFGFILLLSIRDLVTGRAASDNLQRRIRKSALSHPAVEEVLDLKTMIIGNDKILANLELHIRADLTTNELEKIIDDIKASIQKSVPSVFHIQIELETPDRELKIIQT
jgi:cation diffusion facilitator family transporter